MNDDNAQKMLAIFQCGFISGLEHRYECYFCYEDLLAQWGGTTQQEIKENLDDMWNVVLEFEKSLAPDAEEEYTLEQLIKDIEEWYARKR